MLFLKKQKKQQKQTAVGYMEQPRGLKNCNKPFCWVTLFKQLQLLFCYPLGDGATPTSLRHRDIYTQGEVGSACAQ